MTEAEGGWLRRDGDAAVDDAGSVLGVWRVDARRTQVDVAGVLGTTQQHLSQMETGQRPVSLELRRKAVTPGLPEQLRDRLGRGPRQCHRAAQLEVVKRSVVSSGYGLRRCSWCQSEPGAEDGCQPWERESRIQERQTRCPVAGECHAPQRAKCASDPP
ncbi:MAG: helix-turn-helix domain-containing protein [Pseudonocardiaceae bacterium]